MCRPGSSSIRATRSRRASGASTVLSMLLIFSASFFAHLGHRFIAGFRLSGRGRRIFRITAGHAQRQGCVLRRQFIPPVRELLQFVRGGPNQFGHQQMPQRGFARRRVRAERPEDGIVKRDRFAGDVPPDDVAFFPGGENRARAHGHCQQTVRLVLPRICKMGFKIPVRRQCGFHRFAVQAESIKIRIAFPICRD